jgi:5'-3' exonuclease
MNQPPILIVDGLNLFMRHYSVNPSMSDYGFHVGATLGFLNNIKNLARSVEPETIIVVWESGGSARRRAIYPDYKQKKRPKKFNRFYEDIPDTSENFDYQVSTLIKALEYVPVKQLYVEDCEADDVIGYIVKNRIGDQKKVIASSDRDLYQLLDKQTIMWSLGRKKFLNYKDVTKEFGITPMNFCTAKAICGDASDNIPGVDGVGFKVLAKRFTELGKNKFVSCVEIINESKIRSEKSKIKLYNNIIDNEQLILRNWKLMYLDLNNLSAYHIKKIEGQYDLEVPEYHKFNLYRLLIKCGIKNFDVDDFFCTLKFSLRS